MLRMRPPTASARNSCNMSAADVGGAPKEIRGALCLRESKLVGERVWGSVLDRDCSEGLRQRKYSALLRNYILC